MGGTKYDVVILGAGPAGYVGAIRAAQLGLKACVIEKDKVGGVCLNVGCIPSKALIHQAENFASLTEIEEIGVRVDRSGLDYLKVYKKSRIVADTLSGGVSGLLNKNGITLISGTGTLTGPNEITMQNGSVVTGKWLLVATGSRPKIIPGFEFDEKVVMSSTGALMLQELPKQVLILGGGAVGCEFAHILSCFGSKVVLVEMMDHLLPLEDSESAVILERAFKKRGVEVLTGTKATGLEKLTNGAIVTLGQKDGAARKIQVDKVLVVVGRTPNTEGLGLENLGIGTDRGFIPVQDYYRTSIPSIYAAGDVISSPLLAHVASKEAEIAVEHMAGRKTTTRINPNLIPSAVYTLPQIASFGLTEEKAKLAGMTYSKAVFPYRGVGKSVAVGQPEGQAKVLYDPSTHEILGAHIAGADATELIHEILLAKSAELLPEDIAMVIHAHPTLSEITMETMRSIEGWEIHA